MRLVCQDYQKQGADTFGLYQSQSNVDHADHPSKSLRNFRQRSGNKQLTVPWRDLEDKDAAIVAVHVQQSVHII